MVLNFKEQFVEKILSGEKKHTLRRGDRWKPNTIIDFYTDLRTKKSKCFGLSLAEIVINDFMYFDGKYINFNMSATGKYYFTFRNTPPCLNSIAKNDGFDNLNDMQLFFQKYCKEGCYQLIAWDYNFLKDIRLG